MGRAVRRVPADWDHPKDMYGALQPMHDRPFKKDADEWEANYALWLDGERPEYCGSISANLRFWEWEGPPPDPEYYRPDFQEGSCTHYQMYETTSEGTPISPVFATPEALATWLANTRASSFANMSATYEQWLKVCLGDRAVSMVISYGKMQSGVEAQGEMK